MSRPSTCNCECPGCCDCRCCSRSRIRSRRYENNDICVICQGVGEEKTPPRALCDNCEHVYHSGCLDGWLREKNVCPVCQKECKNDPAYIGGLGSARPDPADAPGWEGAIYTGSPRQGLRDRLDSSWSGRLMEMLDELDRANLSQPSPDAEDDDAEETEYRRRRFFIDELMVLRGEIEPDAPLEDLEREYRLLRAELGPGDPSIGERRRRFILQEVRRMGQRSARWETWEGEDLEREYRNLREAVRDEGKEGDESDESDESDEEVVLEFESERDYQIMREALESLDEEKDEREEKGG